MSQADARDDRCEGRQQPGQDRQSEQQRKPEPEQQQEQETGQQQEQETGQQQEQEAGQEQGQEIGLERDQGQEQDYPVASSEAEAAKEEAPVPPLFPLSTQPETSGETPFQFSLSEAFAVLVLLALVLGVTRAFPRTWAAFLTGILLFLSLIAISALKLDRPIVHLGWWALLLVYVLLCIAALVAGR